MKKFFKWFSIFIILVLVYGIYESTSKNKLSEDKSEQADNKKEEKVVNVINEKYATPILTEKEEALIKNLIKDDFSIFADNGKSQFKYDYVVTTAKNMFSVYDKNQVKGDTSFKGKSIIISGVVGSINSGIGDIPYVVLKAGDMFDGVHLSFKKDYRTLAGDLNKGQKVTYACIGDSVIVGTPTLKNCQPVSAVKDKIADDEVKKISDSLKTKSPDEYAVTMYSMSAAMVILNDVNKNKCKDTDIECLIKPLKSKENKLSEIEKNNKLSDEQVIKLKNIQFLFNKIKENKIEKSE